MTALQRQTRIVVFAIAGVISLASMLALSRGLTLPLAQAAERSSLLGPTSDRPVAAATAVAADSQTALLGIVDPLRQGAPPAVPGQQALSWSLWQDLGGTISSAPAAVSWGPGRTDVFARGGSGEVVQTTMEAGRWSPWGTPGELRNIILRSAPACASLAVNSINCVALREGSTGVLQFWWDGQRWSWGDLGGDASSAPAIVAWGNGRLSVFVRNYNGNLIHRYWQAGAANWAPPQWEAVGSGQILSAPACTSRGAGIIDCFALGVDGLVWQLYYDEAAPAGQRWVGWRQLGAPAGLRGNAAPTAVGWGRNLLDVFVRGTDLRLYQLTYTGGWAPTWVPVNDRALISGPGCARVGTKQISCFAQILDVQLPGIVTMNIASGLSYTTAQR